MGNGVGYGGEAEFVFSRNELTGAIGDSVTVLPIVVAVGVLTNLSLSMMLVWFGVCQVVWGLYYGVPVSVEPMKALAALLIAGTITAEELLVAGVLLGGALLVIGATGSLERLGEYVGPPVVRGVQFGVALVLVETGVGLGAANLELAGLALGVAAALIAAGHWNLSAFGVLLVGGAIAAVSAGPPSPGLPATGGTLLFGLSDLTTSAVAASVAQLAMTLGNAALATSVLLWDYFDRRVSPDELSTSMGAMNLVAIPLGAMPMCHGSGGVAGKHAFGARTAGTNVILGVGYVAVAVLAVGVVAAYPPSMLGVILGLIALQLGRTSLGEIDSGVLGYLLVVAIGVCGLVVNLGVAFVGGVLAHLLARRSGRL